MATYNRESTIKDVARAAQVSVGTVSRVLNSNVKVSAELRTRVHKAVEELGYAPNVIAQSMRMRLTHTIGCVLREINIPALGAFVRAAHDVLDEAGFSLVISNSEGRRERERELLRRLGRRQADGAMIALYSEIDQDFDLLLKGLGIPIVLIDRDLPTWSDAVLTDHAEGTRIATRYLLGLGHRRIALITGGLDLYPARERLRGFTSAFRAAGLEPDPKLVHSVSFLPSAGFRYASSMLSSRQRPTAIMAGGIDMLSGILRAVKTSGLRIPEDISLVTCGDSELAELHSPSIGVVRWDQAEVGRLAADLLLDRIAGKASAEPRRVLLPNEFLVRESIAPPAVRE